MRLKTSSLVLPKKKLLLELPRSADIGNKFNSISSVVAAASQKMGITTPLLAMGGLDTLIEGLPPVLTHSLSSVLGNVDFSPLDNVTDESSLSSLEIPAMANIVATRQTIRNVLKYYMASTPLNLKIGLKTSVAGSGVGRTSLQTDLSAGLDVGVGVSAPIIGIGGDVGGGAGLTTLFRTNPLTVSLTALLVGDMIAACDFGAAMISGLIKVRKAQAT